ncbi:MAG TPA: GNAT family N-acetyltransferase [Candidatus Binatia bacterium]|nr:GNAT family N-acetyltransferase [Candidatus Binatia bacterium]
MTTDRLPPEDELTAVTARLRLTPMVAADADDLHPVLDDARLHRFTGGSPLARDQLRAQIARWQARSSPGGTEAWLNWTVRLTATGIAVGYVQATVRGRTAAIAYVVGTAHSGRGIATEAAAAMCEILRTRVGVEELIARIPPDHAASKRVARHLGLDPSGERDRDGEEIWTLRLEP